MNLKAMALIGCAFLVVLASVIAFYLRQATAAASAEDQLVRSENECAAQIQIAVQSVAKKDDGSEWSQVTGSRYHFNRALNTCFVEVSTAEHGASRAYMKTLINSTQHSAVIWSVANRADGPALSCFGADAKPLDCADADRQWNVLMTK